MNNKFSGLTFAFMIIVSGLLFTTYLPEVSAVPQFGNNSLAIVHENFEDDTTGGTTPTGTDYSNSLLQGTNSIQTTTTHSGGKAFTMGGSTNWNQLFSPAFNWCSNLGPTHPYTFWIYLPTLPSGSPGSNTVRIGPYGSSPSHPFYFYIDTDGSIHAGTNSGLQIYAVAGSVHAATWYDFTYYPVSCASGNGIHHIKSTILGIDTDVSGLINSDGAYTMFKFAAANSADNALTGASFIVDDIGTTLVSGIQPTAQLSAALTTPIVGSDISLYGDFVIVRTQESGSVSNVRTYDGKTLAAYATAATNCNLVGGVTSISNQGMAYTACTAADHSHPFSIKFANYFNAPFPYGNCEAVVCGTALTNCPSYVCTGEFTLPASMQAKTLVNLAAVTQEVTQLNTPTLQKFYGFNLLYDEANGKVDNISPSYFIYGVGSGPTTVGNRVCTSAGSGNKGYCTFISESELTDGSQIMDQICSYNNLKAYTANQIANGQEFTSTPLVTFSDPSFVVTLTNSFHEPFDNALSVDCGNAYNIGLTSTTVSMLSQNSHLIRWSKTITSGQKATISGNGTYAAYSAGGTTHVVYGTNGTDIITFTNPIGSLVNLQMDDLAQRLYLIMSDNIYMYDIHGNTTHSVVNPSDTSNCVINCADNGSHTVSSSSTGSVNQIVSTGTVTLNTGDNILGINIPYTAEGLGISRTAVLLLLSVVLMGVFAIWIYRNTESIIGLVIGAFLGLVLSVAMSLIPEWAIILVALLLLILFGKMIFGGFYGGGEE